MDTKHMLDIVALTDHVETYHPGAERVTIQIWPDRENALIDPSHETAPLSELTQYIQYAQQNQMAVGVQLNGHERQRGAKVPLRWVMVDCDGHAPYNAIQWPQGAAPARIDARGDNSSYWHASFRIAATPDQLPLYHRVCLLAAAFGHGDPLNNPKQIVRLSGTDRFKDLTNITQYHAVYRDPNAPAIPLQQLHDILESAIQYDYDAYQRYQRYIATHQSHDGNFIDGNPEAQADEADYKSFNETLYKYFGVDPGDGNRVDAIKHITIAAIGKAIEEDEALELIADHCSLQGYENIHNIERTVRGIYNRYDNQFGNATKALHREKAQYDAHQRMERQLAANPAPPEARSSTPPPTSTPQASNEPQEGDAANRPPAAPPNPNEKPSGAPWGATSEEGQEIGEQYIVDWMIAQYQEMGSDLQAWEGVIYMFSEGRYWVPLPDHKGRHMIQIFLRARNIKVTSAKVGRVLQSLKDKLTCHAAPKESPPFVRGVGGPMLKQAFFTRNGYMITIGDNGQHTVCASPREVFWLHTLDVDYDPQAQCPKYHTLLDGQMSPAIKHQFLKYNCTVFLDESPQRFLWVRGEKGTGKSTFYSGLSHMLGMDMVMEVKKRMLESSHFGEGIEQARLIISDDPTADFKTSQMNLDLLKEISTSRNFSVNPKGTKAVKWELKARAVYITNGIPYMSNDDGSFTSRAFPIPIIGRSHRGTKGENIHLTNELIAENSGLLNLLLSYITVYMREGLHLCQEQVDMLDNIRENISPFDTYYSKYFEIGPHVQDSRVFCKDIYSFYCYQRDQHDWEETKGMDRRKFIRKTLSTKSVTKHRAGEAQGREYYLQGLKPKNDIEFYHIIHEHKYSDQGIEITGVLTPV